MKLYRKAVYLVQHSHELDGEDEVKVIGVFSAKRHALAAVKFLQKQPGFRRHPNGFYVDRTNLNEIGWKEGFITVRPRTRVTSKSGAKKKPIKRGRVVPRYQR
jgi:hypothetical protein